MNLVRLIFVAVAGVAALFYHRRRTARRRAVDHVTTTRSIVNFSFSGATNIDQRLPLRAIPNARLVQAFGINNSFTTADRLVHKTFLARASRDLQRISCSDWQDLYSIANAYALWQSYSQQVPLAKLVRRLCFRAVLRAFLSVDVSDAGDEHVSIATEAINEQWVKSKSPCGSASLTPSDTLNESLRCLLESGPCPPPPPQQALDIILPAYETLWRVVLLTFVSACHRSSKAARLAEMDIPACLGTNTETERSALQIGKASTHPGSVDAALANTYRKVFVSTRRLSASTARAPTTPPSSLPTLSSAIGTRSSGVRTRSSSGPAVSTTSPSCSRARIYRSACRRISARHTRDLATGL